VQWQQSLSPSGQAVAGSATLSNSQSTHWQHPSLSQELQQQIQSHTRAPAQQVLEVGSLQDLWLPNPAGWSSAAANLLNNALGSTMPATYASSRGTALLMTSHLPQNKTRLFEWLPASLNQPHGQTSNLAPQLPVSPLPLAPFKRPQTSTQPVIPSSLE